MDLLKGVLKLVKSTRGLVIAVLVMGLVLLAACGDDSTATPRPTPTTPAPTSTTLPQATPTTAPAPTSLPASSTPTTAPAATPTIPSAVTSTPAPTATPSPFPLTIVDSSGNEVVLEEPPERMIVYDGAAVEILFAIGEGHRIIGTHGFVSYPPETEDIPKLGGAFDVNLEQTVALEPDLFYIFYDRFNADLQAVGVKVLYIESLNNNVQETLDHFRLWGTITGKVDAAEQEIAKVQARLDALAAVLEGVEQGPRLYHHGFDFQFVAGGDTLMGDIYAFLKADLISKELSGYKPFSPEDVVASDPEVIVASAFDLDFVTEHPALQGTTAIMNGRVVVPSRGSLDVAGTRLIDAIEELAELLYPGLFP